MSEAVRIVMLQTAWGSPDGIQNIKYLEGESYAVSESLAECFFKMEAAMLESEFLAAIEDDPKEEKKPEAKPKGKAKGAKKTGGKGRKGAKK